MKTLFIPAKLKSQINKDKIKSLFAKLPENTSIAYSIQYENFARQIKEVIPRKVTSLTQVLGCTIHRFSKSTKAILLLTDGKFHALSLAQQTKLPIYLLVGYKLTKFLTKDIEILQKKQRASYLKFLNSKSIGIIVSTKPGQQNLKKAIELRNKLSNKKSYLFICNNIRTEEFENFGLDSWVNTACPRLDMSDKNNSIINFANL